MEREREKKKREKFGRVTRVGTFRKFRKGLTELYFSKFFDMDKNHNRKVCYINVISDFWIFSATHLSDLFRAI